MRSRKRLVKAVKLAITICILLIFLFPLYWLFTNSAKTNIEIFSNPPTLWPRNFSLRNYVNVLGDRTLNIQRALLNSLSTAVGVALFTILFSLPAAYGLAKFNIRFCRTFLMICIIGQMLSPTVKLIPLFIMFRDLNIINRYPSTLIALGTYTIPFAILILRPFFMSIPDAITESGMLDGCGQFSAFIRLMVPIAYPGIVVSVIFTFLSGWNDLIYPMTFYTDAYKRPLIANMYAYISEYGTQWNMLMTFAVISVLPVILLFFLTQRYIVGGIALGAVKG